ncbi:hypothetical protein ACFO3K_02600 [Cellulomonas algicola]|uniref:hypothetical protein n=1 Tax=Cellulomonas algicola TaxID=2071633 RepID=UPI001C3F99AD|nr:hypothetical protein [Cellulomonas algicola]
MSDLTRTTTDPDEIRRFVEGHQAVPALIRAVYPEDPRMPAVIFPEGPSGHGAERATWEEFFAALDASNLAFQYPLPATPGGHTPPFFELIQREDD